MPTGTLDPACPLSASYQLNDAYPLVAEWAVPPLSGWRGGLTFRDLIRGRRNPHDGTIVTSGTPTWVAGPPNQYGAIRLDGTSEYITTANIPSYSSGDFSATWNLWVRLRSAGFYPMLVTQGAAVKIWLGAGSNQTPEFFPDNGHIVSSASLVLGNWCMVTCTTGCFSQPGATMYINGISVGTDPGGYANTSVASPQFGRRDDGFYAPIDLASVQYWFGAGTSAKLSAGDVAAIYAEMQQGNPERWRWVKPWSTGTTVTPGPPSDDLPWLVKTCVEYDYLD